MLIKRDKNNPMGKKSLFNKWCQTSGQRQAKEEAGDLSHTIPKINFKTDHKPKCKH